MAEQYFGMTVAMTIVTASIVLAGILIGVGRAFSYKRLENFGMQELVQSVINAAIIGALASVIALISGISASIVTSQCGTGDAPAQLSCVRGQLKLSIFLMLQEVVQTTELLGYYQSMVLNFNVFSIQPFANLSAVSGVLSSQVLTLQLLLMLTQLNAQVLDFVSQNAIILLLPLGLVLRTLFATRKAGGFLIALAIGLYLFYPSLVIIFPSPESEVGNATALMQNFTNNSFYATVPVIDLNDNYAIGGKLDIMAGRCSGNISNSSACANMTQTMGMVNQTADFSGDLTVIIQSNSDAIAKVTLYSAIAPLLSLIVTFVFVKEVGSVLGSEIGLGTFTAI